LHAERIRLASKETVRRERGRLWSGDRNSGQMIAGVEVRNPFGEHRER
jgi:hypothetical protein